MIASVIALIALAAVLTVYSGTARHSAQQLQRAHLHQQLHSLMHFMTRELRRAGYWQFDPQLHNPADNPFQTWRNQIHIESVDDVAADGCIRFSYDLDRDGLVGVGHCQNGACRDGTDDDNVEQFGFRLRNQAVQSRYGGAQFSCNSGYWQAVTDQDIQVTQLRFDQTETCLNLTEPDQACVPQTPQLIQRLIEIKLAAQLAADPDIELKLDATVHIRNDQIKPGSEAS
jgi:type II secretory pathway component PulJ